MPKLNQKEAKAVKEAETLDFSPVAPGIYPVRLMDVEQKDGKQYPYWSVEFQHEDPANQNKKQWTNLSKSPKAAFKMQEFFDAFEVPPSTDTDEMCGSVILAAIKIATIEEGKRAGELTNEIYRLMPYDESKIDVPMDGDEDFSEAAGDPDFD